MYRCPHTFAHTVFCGFLFRFWKNIWNDFTSRKRRDIFRSVESDDTVQTDCNYFQMWLIHSLSLTPFLPFYFTLSVFPFHPCLSPWCPSLFLSPQVAPVFFPLRMVSSMMATVTPPWPRAWTHRPAVRTERGWSATPGRCLSEASPLT